MRRFIHLLICGMLLGVALFFSSCSPQLYGRGYRKAVRGCDCTRLKIIGYDRDAAGCTIDIQERLSVPGTAPIRSERM